MFNSVVCCKWVTNIISSQRGWITISISFTLNKLCFDAIVCSPYVQFNCCYYLSSSCGLRYSLVVSRKLHPFLGIRPWFESHLPILHQIYQKVLSKFNLRMGALLEVYQRMNGHFVYWLASIMIPWILRFWVSSDVLVCLRSMLLHVFQNRCMT